MRVTEVFFESFEEIVEAAEEYDLILLPFRFVLSDIPLVVLELACSGTLVVTTPYSHVARSSPNMLILGINELEDVNRVTRLASLARRLHDRHHYTISWEDFTNLLNEMLKGEG